MLLQKIIWWCYIESWKRNSWNFKNRISKIRVSRSLAHKKKGRIRFHMVHSIKKFRAVGATVPKLFQKRLRFHRLVCFDRWVYNVETCLVYVCMHSLFDERQVHNNEEQDHSNNLGH